MTTRRGAPSVPSRRRRWRRGAVALLVGLVIAPAASTAGEGTSIVYIWRDASGVVRFSTPPPR